MSVARPLEIGQPRWWAGLRLSNLPLLAGLAFALAALLSLLYLAQTSGVAITAYDIQELSAERDQWRHRNDQLRLQIAEAQSLDRVERAAQQRLAMAPPARVVFVPRPAPPAATPTPAEGGLLDSARRALSQTLAWRWEGS